MPTPTPDYGPTVGLPVDATILIADGGVGLSRLIMAVPYSQAVSTSGRTPDGRETVMIEDRAGIAAIRPGVWKPLELTFKALNCDVPDANGMTLGNVIRGDGGWTNAVSTCPARTFGGRKVFSVQLILDGVARGSGEIIKTYPCCLIEETGEAEEAGGNGRTIKITALPWSTTGANANPETLTAAKFQ